MDAAKEIREFLMSRRARVSPEDVGLPRYDARRKVSGLRREEVAILAGLSVDYYTRVERGTARGVSYSVLAAIARALRLDDAETTHLFDLYAVAPSPNKMHHSSSASRVRPTVQRILDSITDTPAIINNGRTDLVAANDLGRALYAPMYVGPSMAEGIPNHARFIFLDPRARSFYSDWFAAAHNNVAMLHAEAGKNPRSKSLMILVGQLSTSSPDFARWWADHDVRFHCSGTKSMNHPDLGELVLDFEAMDLSADDGLSLVVYTAHPDTGTEDTLKLLASWTASEASGSEEDSDAPVSL